MTETSCECGCGRVATWSRDFTNSKAETLRDLGTVYMCQQCASGGFPGNGETIGGWPTLVRSRRAQPKAELEALDFVHTRGFNLGTDACCKASLRAAPYDRVTFRPSDDGAKNWHYDAGVVQMTCCELCVPPLYAQLLALRDGYSNATPPAPSAVEPKPNPLRGDAAPGTCRSCSAFAAVRISANCTYCASRLHGQVRHVEDGDGIVAAVQPAAVEEVRYPADWAVDPNAPDGVA